MHKKQDLGNTIACDKTMIMDDWQKYRTLIQLYNYV